MVRNQHKDHQHNEKKIILIYSILTVSQPDQSPLQVDKKKVKKDENEKDNFLLELAQSLPEGVFFPGFYLFRKSSSFTGNFWTL